MDADVFNADALAADSADVLAADNADVLAAADADENGYTLVT